MCQPTASCGSFIAYGKFFRLLYIGVNSWYLPVLSDQISDDKTFRVWHLITYNVSHLEFLKFQNVSFHW